MSLTSFLKSKYESNLAELGGGYFVNDLLDGLQPYVSNQITVEIGAEALGTLFSVPVEAIPEPDAGYAVIIDKIIASGTNSTVAATGTAAISFSYTDESGTVLASTFPAGLSGVDDETLVYVASGVTTTIVPETASVVIWMATADPTVVTDEVVVTDNTDTVLTFTILYRLIEI